MPGCARKRAEAVASWPAALSWAEDAASAAASMLLRPPPLCKDTNERIILNDFHRFQYSIGKTQAAQAGTCGPRRRRRQGDALALGVLAVLRDGDRDGI